MHPFFIQIYPQRLEKNNKQKITDNETKNTQAHSAEFVLFTIYSPCSIFIRRIEVEREYFIKAKTIKLTKQTTKNSTF